jgi:hypothetical protein
MRTSEFLSGATSSEAQPGVISSRQGKTAGLALLLFGSFLLYYILAALLIRVFSPNVVLHHEHLTAAGGLMIWAGSSLCPRWRVVLGLVCIAFSSVSFLNSHYCHALAASAHFAKASPEILALCAQGKAASTMAVSAFVIGVCLLGSQRAPRNQNQGPPR